MTTIAVRDGIVAFDSRVSEDDGTIAPNGIRKAWASSKHRVIYAGAGTLSNWQDIARSIDAMRILPWNSKRYRKLGVRLDDNSTILVIAHDGRVFQIEFESWYAVGSPFCAIGTGQQAALTVMHPPYNATAKRAVEAAIKVDRNSGGPVNILRVCDL